MKTKHNHRNRFLQAFVYLMIASSIIHLTIIGIYTLLSHDFSKINFFSIVGIDILFPQILISPLSYVYSVVVTALLYLACLVYENRHTR